MTETYVTYLLWDGCRAPGNLEYNGKLCGQRVSAVPFEVAFFPGDADISEWVEGIEEPFATYVKRLIREDMERNKG